MKNLFIVFCFVFIPYLSFSQSSDSTDISYSWKRSINGNKQIYDIDTSINSFNTSLNNLYNNPVLRNIGNIGLPMYNLLFEYNEKFSFIENNKPYMISKENIVFFNVKKPITLFTYVSGPKKEQELALFHTQNVNKNLNFGINLYVISAPGVYSRQTTKNNSFSFFGSYNSDQYESSFSIIRSKFNYLESGGIVDNSYLLDSLDNSDDINNPNQIPINLFSANNYIIVKELNYDHQYNIGKYVNKYINDSTDIKTYRPALKLLHSFTYNNYYRNYIDKTDTTTFYTNIYNKSNTFDSVYFGNFSNRISVKSGNLTFNKLQGYVLFAQEYNLNRYSYFNKDTLFDYSKDTLIGFNKTGFNMSFSYDSLWFADINSVYYYDSYYKNNYSADIKISKIIHHKNDTSFITFFAQNLVKEHEYFISNYRSNHIIWNVNTQGRGQWVTKLDINYDRPKWKFDVSLNGQLLDNTLYFDSLGYPKINDTAFIVYRVRLNKDFHFWNIYIKNSIIYQETDNQSSISLPSLVFRNSTYFQKNIHFNSTDGDMLTQIGFDVLYFSKFVGPSYYPATGQFLFQNSQEIGAYPFVDFFINLKIKRMRLFFKFDHVSEGLTDRNYFNAIGYPISGRTFKFGLGWSFYD